MKRVKSELSHLLKFVLIFLHDVTKMWKDTYHACLGCSFHGNLSLGVHAKAGVQDAVTDLIAKLVRVTFTDGLGGEVDVLVVCGLLLLLGGFCHLFLFSFFDFYFCLSMITESKFPEY